MIDPADLVALATTVPTGTLDALDTLDDPFGRLGELASWWSRIHADQDLRRERVTTMVFDSTGNAERAARDLTLTAHEGVRLVMITDFEPSPIDGAVATVDRLVDEGCDLLVLSCASPHSALAATAALAAMSDTEPVKALGYDDRIDDVQWMASVATVRDLRQRVQFHRRAPAELLAQLDCAELSAAAAAILHASARRTPVILDGTACAVAALVAQRLAGSVAAGWQIGASTGGQAQASAALLLGLTPIADFRILDGHITASATCVATIAAALATRR
jgi:NaMN:DMB phosphoribosyltransferase